MSQRGEDWTYFAAAVFNHIEDYTVSQYGDKGHDQATDFTVEEIVMNMKRYLNRVGRNSREGEQERDCLKLAHYACMLKEKLVEEGKI